MGSLYGDKGYLSKELGNLLFDPGLHLVTGIRNNMKNVMMTMRDKILLRNRSVIETINDQLKNIAQAEHSRHSPEASGLVILLQIWSPVLLLILFKKKNRVLSLKQKTQHNWLFFGKSLYRTEVKSKESVEDQIEKINKRAKRMLELDAEKVHNKIIEARSESEELTVLGKQKHGNATELLNRLILWNALNWPKKATLWYAIGY